MKKIAVYLALINLLTFAAYGIDKRKAQKNAWRIKESTLLLLAAAVILALCLGGAKHGGEKPQRTDAKGGTNEARIAFLAEYGWEVSAEPVQTQQVRVPEEPGEVFLRYNELQVSQGYDLLQYSGQELTRYVYQVTNYPDSSGTYYATLLVKDGQIVGADIASSAKNGVMHGLKMPE